MIHVPRISEFSVFRPSWPVIDSFFRSYRRRGKRLGPGHLRL